MIDLYVLAPLADWSANVDILRLLRLGKLVSCLPTEKSARCIKPKGNILQSNWSQLGYGRL